MDRNDLLKTVAYGALAGVAATVAVQAAKSLNEKVAHRNSYSLAQEPGEPARYSLISSLPKPVESAGAALLQYAYGSTGTALYSALRSDSESAIEGVALGAAVWAASRLGWIPNIGRPTNAASSFARHLLFGIATMGAYHKLRTQSASAS